MNTHIQSLNNHEMNTQIHSLALWRKQEGERDVASASEHAVQNYFCPVRQVRLARQLRLAWFYFDPLGTFAPLAGLLHLISCPTTISPGRSHNLYYHSTTSLGPAAWFDSFPPLVWFAPLGPCPVLSNFLKRLLVILSSLEGIRYLQCSALAATVSYLDLIVLRLAPCSHHVCFLGSTDLCGSRLYCASRTICLLYCLVVSLCHTECSRTNTQ